MARTGGGGVGVGGDDDDVVVRGIRLSRLLLVGGRLPVVSVWREVKENAVLETGNPGSRPVG